MAYFAGALGRRVVLASALLCLGASVWAADKWGVLVMHGKSPGGANDTSTDSVVSKLQAAGALTLKPDMPWSKARYIDQPLAGAVAEIGEHIQALRAQGANRIAIAGHSMGCPAAMAYAAQKGGIDALILLAPGHVPQRYYNSKQTTIVRDSVNQAREMVARGDGDKSNVPFADINQGNRRSVFTSANIYLSYFDPNGDGEMAVTAARVPASTAVLWVVGKDDSMISAGRGYVFDKLPGNPKSQYLEVDANHHTTPDVAADAVVRWLGGL